MEDQEKSFEQMRPELDEAWRAWTNTPRRNKALYEDKLNAFNALCNSWAQSDKKRVRVIADYISAKLASTYGRR